MVLYLPETNRFGPLKNGGFPIGISEIPGVPLFRCKNFTSLHRGDATEALSEELTNDLLGGMKNDGKAAAEALLELLYLAKKEGAEVTLVTLGVVVVVVVVVVLGP